VRIAERSSCFLMARKALDLLRLQLLSWLKLSHVRRSPGREEADLVADMEDLLDLFR